MNLANYIKTKRLELGLTQIELSKLSKVKQSTISNIEKGRTSVNLDTLFKLAEGLNVKLTFSFRDSSRSEFSDIVVK